MRVREEIRETLRLALPIAFAQVSLITLGLVDAALVGRASEADLSAVAMGNSLVFTVVCPAMGVTMAVEPLASQAVGAGDQERAWTSLRAGIVACLLLSIPTIFIGALSPLLLVLFGVDPIVLPAARAFVYARLPSMPMWLLFMAAKAYLEARGVTRPLFVFGWIANVINFVVVGTLVFGDRALAFVHLKPMGLPALGSLGAGLGTSVSNGLLATGALAVAYRIRPKGATLLGGGKHLQETVVKLLRVGVPIGFQVLTEAGVFAIMGLLAGRLGARTSAAHQIAMSLASLTFMGVLGISSATAVRVGRAIGARDRGGPRRAGLVGFGLVAVYMGSCALVFCTAPSILARVFTQNPEVVATAALLIRVAAAFQIADGIQGVAGGALRGAADTRFASFANIVCHWGIGLPLALVFTFMLGRGAPGLWWGMSIGLIVVATMQAARFVYISSKPIAAV